MHFQVPASCGADINVTGDANVDVKDLEGGPFEIVTDQGRCHVKNLKGSSMKAKTSGGNIICQSQLLFELGFLDTKRKGNIFVKKLQGKEFYLATEHGDVEVGATYALKAALTSKHGCIKLGDIHGEYSEYFLLFTVSNNILTWTIYTWGVEGGEINRVA